MPDWFEQHAPPKPKSSRPPNDGEIGWFQQNASQPQPSAPPEETEQTSAFDRFITNFVGALDPRPLVEAVMDPIGAAKGLYNAQTEQFDKAREAYNEGRYSEMLGHGLANALPILGPAAANIGEQIGRGDVAGGAGQMAAALVPGAALKGVKAGKLPQRLQDSARHSYSQALSPTKAVLKDRAKKIIPELLRRREGAASREALLGRAKGRQQQALDALDKAEAQIPAEATVRTGPVVNALRKARDRATGAVTTVPTRVPSPTGLVDARGNPFMTSGKPKTFVMGNEGAIRNLGRMKRQVETLGDEVPYGKLKRVRQVTDREVGEAGGYGGTLRERSMLNAKREMANAIRKEISKFSPDIAKINAEYSLWKSVDEILEETMKRRVGQRSLGQSIAQTGFGSGGMLTGAATGGLGGALGGAALGAGLGRVVSQGLSSPGWKMFSAVKKQQLADLLARGNFRPVTKVSAPLIFSGAE